MMIMVKKHNPTSDIRHVREGGERRGSNMGPFLGEISEKRAERRTKNEEKLSSDNVY